MLLSAVHDKSHTDIPPHPHSPHIPRFFHAPFIIRITWHVQVISIFSTILSSSFSYRAYIQK